MTVIEAAEDVSEKTRWVSAWTLASLAFVAALVTLIAMLVDHATVTTLKELGGTSFGFPFDWLTQDQSAVPPPLPARLSPASPWENPTNVALGPLIFDFLVVYAVLLVGWLVGRSVVPRLKTAAR